MDDSHLSHLPLELRRTIYKLITDDDEGDTNPLVPTNRHSSDGEEEHDDVNDEEWYSGLALAHTCSQLYHEVMLVLLSKPKVSFGSAVEAGGSPMADFARFLHRVRTWLEVFNPHTAHVKKFVLFGPELHQCVHHQILFFRQLERSSVSLQQCRLEIELINYTTASRWPKIRLWFPMNLTIYRANDKAVDFDFTLRIDLRSIEIKDGLRHASLGMPPNETNEAGERWGRHKLYLQELVRRLFYGSYR